MALAVGTRLGPYEIVAPLGAGGMGEVYRARDPRIRREVAVKVLPAAYAADPDRLRRFEQEATAAGGLNHPNVLAIYDVGSEDGVPYLVSELLEGETLRERMSQPLPPRRALDHAVQIARGLAAAHDRGIIHRDLKPENVFVTRDGHLKILDFGLAKLRQAAESGAGESDVLTATRGTSPGAVLGTAGYMSPEQVRGEPADHRSDIFSFGAILYEMLSGRRAFAGDSAVETMNAILKEEPPELLEITRGMTPGLERVVRHCLEKRVEDRFQSARDLGFDLETLSGAGTATEAHPGGHAQSRSPAARNRVALGAVALAAAAVLALWTARERRDPPSPAGAGPGAARKTLAVLPFQNLGGDRSGEFLRLALPDEIVTALSHEPSLAIRPFSQTRKYAAADVDPQRAGAELRVTEVLAGHYLQEGERLQVTMEVIDVAENRLVWRDTLTVAGTDLIGLRDQMLARLRQGLLPKVGNRPSGTQSNHPTSTEAYDLFLRAAAIAHDAEANEQALAMLERAVTLDAGFAPAWMALGRRYYYHAQYGAGGRAAEERSRAANERAIALDPNLIEAAAALVTARTEAGNLERAYDEARDLVRRRPESAEAHHVLGYVLRYAGLLDEAARECETALTLDPRNFAWRSCAVTFMHKGQFERAWEYTNLDAGSEWSYSTGGLIELHRGQPEKARALLAKGAPRFQRGAALLAAVGERRPAAQIEEAAHRLEAAVAGLTDPEPRYMAATVLAHCGSRQSALRLLRQAVEGGYGPYPAMETSLPLAGLRGSAEFAVILGMAAERQKAFLAHRAAVR